MERLYQAVFERHLTEHRQMVFVIGPRQAGKTTVTQTLVNDWGDANYLNWDNINDREIIIVGPEAIADRVSLEQLRSRPTLIAFDEIHKFKDWRDFLKGLYDSYPDKSRIIVTGCAKLDVFSRGGDSLMGRYFPFHFHPLSIAELTQNGANLTQEYWPQPRELSSEQFSALWNFGGYPDPFLKNSERFSQRWKSLRRQQLFDEDIRDLTRIHDIDRLELLAEQLKRCVGSLTSFQKLAKHIRVSDNTIRSWLSRLKALYYCFEIRPWSQNISRSLLKEPKYYLWDWSLCMDDGTKAENLVALHLLKAIHFWNDLGMGEYGLHFIRDKEKREVDFLVTKNSKPWILVEVKLGSNSRISSALRYYTDVLKPEFSFQIVMNLPYVDKNCFQQAGVQVVPALTFLSQLV